MSLIMGLDSNWSQATRVICPSIRVASFDFVYTLASTCIYDANLEIFMFESKTLTALKLCMNHHLVYIHKFYTQDAPDLNTGPVLVQRHLYICTVDTRLEIGIIEFPVKSSKFPSPNVVPSLFRIKIFF